MSGGAIDYDMWWRLTRLEIARETGWTLEYIDDLDHETVSTFVGRWNALDKARKKLDGDNHS